LSPGDAEGCAVVLPSDQPEAGGDDDVFHFGFIFEPVEDGLFGPEVCDETCNDDGPIDQMCAAIRQERAMRFCRRYGISPGGGVCSVEYFAYICRSFG
jgi:hypothetical protein